MRCVVAGLGAEGAILAAPPGSGADNGAQAGHLAEAGPADGVGFPGQEGKLLSLGPGQDIQQPVLLGPREGCALAQAARPLPNQRFKTNITGH